ncbi:hypothetical protein HZZ00_19375 [Streptomyces sp. NEAU-sy36]|uniref:hypothetical protein n=1 Tax=unclassified Streptomyces TaxID=2593676 RepID=UPI0015D5784B|nr:MULTISPECIES: hypothetical protein [unclassified Streptomyces]QLI99516.1 hypothetical protein HZZ00_19375 [Streptomyces sp. NEAU-sy36]
MGCSAVLGLSGADAVEAATKAADAARERAQYLLATRLEQLRELAARQLDGDTAGAVIA